MMFRLLTLTAVIGWLSLPAVLWRLRCGLRGTSLSGLWSLLGGAWIAWGVAGAASLLTVWPTGAIDLVWYAVAVVMLLPPIAVLGARRPVHRVWPWFVLLPLLCVFAWPALSAFSAGKSPPSWTLEEPVLVGYALVLVMGAGNYVGLRSTMPALLWMTALVLLVAPLCPATSAAAPRADAGRVGAALLLNFAAWLAAIRARRSVNGGGADPGARFQQVWLDFRDTFGIVWARRVQERFNDEMRRQGVTIRLGIDGWEGGAELTPSTWRQAEASLRWLLQKFVDSAWIDARIPPIAPESTAGATPLR